MKFDIKKWLGIQEKRRPSRRRSAKRASKGPSVHPKEDPGSWLGAGGESHAGPEVTDTTALTLAAVFGAVKILAEDVATVPLKVYRRLKEGKEEAGDHSLYPVLHDAPNPEMSSTDFRESMMMWLGLRGNSYAEVVRDGSGRVVELWPLHAPSMEVRRLNGRLTYLYHLPNGEKAVLFGDEVLHVRALSLDGIMGLSPVAFARENIGLGLAAQEYGARLFSNNSVPKGVIEATGKFKDEEVLKRFKRQVEEAHQGLSKAHRVMVLENGMKWVATGLPPEDAQFLELRKYQVSDIARLYRIAASKLSDTEKRAFASVEQDSLDHVVYTLRPWYVRWEQGINRVLLTPSERRQYFAEHLVDGFLRGDVAARFEAYTKALNNGMLNIDEARAMENRNPLPDGLGKKFRVPLNTVALGEEAKEEQDKDDEEKQPEPDDESQEGKPKVVKSQNLSNGFRHAIP